jgi:hypothetical protein
MPQKTILHITVGTPEWEPTQEDLKNVTEAFHEATISEGLHHRLVITRQGVVVRVLNVEQTPEIKVVSANIESMEKLK